MNSEGAQDAKAEEASGEASASGALRLVLLCCSRLFVLLTLLFCGFAAEAGPVLETNATNVAKLLAAADTWLLPQPKAVAHERGVL